MNRDVVIASLVGFFGSVLAIGLGYTDYDLIGISVGDALTPVWKWPVFGMAIMLTTLSLSVPFAAHFFRARDAAMGIAIYAFGYLWLPFFIFYPGTHALGVVSDNAAPYVWFGVCIAQYIAARVVAKTIRVEVTHRAV
jgi:hypothetical protein